jgi:predicted glycosyltransferase involved in capsule biosynthesis
MAVNGWNESFSGWGLEDTELVARLYFSGVVLRKLKFSAITYHMWHPVADRSALTENRNLLRECIENRFSWCDNGLIKRESS